MVKFYADDKFAEGSFFRRLYLDEFGLNRADVGQLDKRFVDDFIKIVKLTDNNYRNKVLESEFDFINDKVLYAFSRNYGFDSFQTVLFVMDKKNYILKNEEESFEKYLTQKIFKLNEYLSPTSGNLRECKYDCNDILNQFVDDLVGFSYRIQYIAKSIIENYNLDKLQATLFLRNYKDLILNDSMEILTNDPKSTLRKDKMGIGYSLAISNLDVIISNIKKIINNKQAFQLKNWNIYNLNNPEILKKLQFIKGIDTIKDEYLLKLFLYVKDYDLFCRYVDILNKVDDKTADLILEFIKPTSFYLMKSTLNYGDFEYYRNDKNPDEISNRYKLLMELYLYIYQKDGSITKNPEYWKREIAKEKSLNDIDFAMYDYIHFARTLDHFRIVDVKSKKVFNNDNYPFFKNNNYFFTENPDLVEKIVEYEDGYNRLNTLLKIKRYILDNIPNSIDNRKAITKWVNGDEKIVNFEGEISFSEDKINNILNLFKEISQRFITDNIDISDFTNNIDDINLLEFLKEYVGTLQRGKVLCLDIS